MVTAHVGLLAVLSPNLVQLRWQGDTRSDRDALWVRSRLRKRAVCSVTGRALEPGEWAFRPVGNHDYRMQRIWVDVIEAMISIAESKVEEE